MANESKLLTITRLIDAPVALVFKAWSDPALVMKWWGPGGFTAPTIKIDFRVGGKYLFCMRSPDGQDFWSTGMFKEIVPMQRIVWTDSFADAKGNIVPAAQYGIPGDFPEETEVTILFEAVGNRTKLTLQHAGLPNQMSEMTLSGWTESLVKFDAAVEPSTIAPGRKELVITRTFNATRDLVYKAWTKSDMLAKWWGPKDYDTHVVKLDLRTGGIFHYRMVTPAGDQLYGKFVFREIEAPHRIAFVDSFSDKHEGITRHPMSAGWPMELLNIVTFEEKDGKTLLTLRAWPIHETDEERSTFESAMGSLQHGFKGTLDQLESYINTL